MNRTVLDTATPAKPRFHLYAHCLKETAGGVSLLVINSSPVSHLLQLPAAGIRYTLHSDRLRGKTVRLNGSRLELRGSDEIPSLRGAPYAPGPMRFAPFTITFLAIPGAHNRAC